MLIFASKTKTSTIMKKQKNTLTSKQYIIPFMLITSLFFLWGFARAILDVLNKHFQDSLNIGITQSALIQVTTYMGYFLMAIPAGMFINRYGYRRGVVFGLSLFALGSFLFYPSMSFEGQTAFYAFVGSLFIIACGLAFLETSANPYATELGPSETATSRLNLSQSFNGMGSFLAPLIVGGFLFSDTQDGNTANVSIPYMIMGCVVVFIAVVFSFIKLPDITTEDDAPTPQQNEKDSSIKALLRNRIFMLGLISLLAYEVSEISINSYFVNFTTSMGWLQSSTASYILSLGLVVFMLGRFIGSGLMMVMKPERMLSICALGCVASLSLLMLTAHLDAGENGIFSKMSLGFLIANYFFESIMFPTIFSLALQGLQHQTKTASSLLMMTPVGGCGFLLVAWVADNSTPLIPFFIPLMGFAIVLYYARELQKKGQCNK